MGILASIRGLINAYRKFPNRFFGVPDIMPVNTLYRFLRDSAFFENGTVNGRIASTAVDKLPSFPVFFPLSREFGGE
jgi:hypothetical protein